MGADTLLGWRGDYPVFLAASRETLGRLLGRNRSVWKTGSVESTPYEAGFFRDFEQLACNLHCNLPVLWHRYRNSGLLKIARQYPRAGCFGNNPANELMRKSEGVALPLPRHLSHLIDARYFLNTRGWRRTACAARSCRV